MPEFREITRNGHDPLTISINSIGNLQVYDCDGDHLFTMPGDSSDAAIWSMKFEKDDSYRMGIKVGRFQMAHAINQLLEEGK